MSELPMHFPAQLGATEYTFREVSTARLQDTWTGSQKLVQPDCLLASAEVISESMLAGHAIQTLYGANTYPDHDTLRCIDHMINRTDWTRSQQVNAGNWLAQYFITNHARLGVYLMIWNTKIIRSYDKTVDGQLVKAWNWARYEGSDNPHTDHVHVQYVEGYKYAPPAQSRDGALYQVTASVLNGRQSPSTSAPILVTRKKGVQLRILSATTTGGMTWGKADDGAWYAMEYLQIVGTWYVATAAVNGRYEPTTFSTAVPRSTGFEPLIQTTISNVEGHNWGRASGGLWYALDNLRKK